MSRKSKPVRFFPGAGSSRLSRQRGNLAYVLMGTLAAAGGIAVVATRNTQTAKEQALEDTSRIARDRNVSALNMLKVLMALPVSIPSPRDPAHVPAIFPDSYVNSTAPLSVKLGQIANSTSGLWQITGSATEPQIVIKSPDHRFLGDTGASGKVFTGSHYSATPSGPASVQTLINSVRPVYKGGTGNDQFLITNYDVSVTSNVAVSQRDPAKGRRNVTTNARIKVDPPPTPECDMTTLADPMTPVAPGTDVYLKLRSYGVVSTARILRPDKTGELTWKSVTVPENAKSIRSTLLGGTDFGVLKVEAHQTDKVSDSRIAEMRLQVEVTGPAGGSKTCKATKRVYIAPTCSITASPLHVPDRGTTTLTVRASGAVDSMTLLGITYTGAAALKQSVGWSPVRSGSLTATATVKGPESMVGTCSVTIFKDPPKCRFATGTKEFYAPVGWVVPAWDNNYHQIWADWQTSGGSCDRNGITFTDRTCVPCPAGDLCGRYNPNGASNPSGAQFWRIINYHGGPDCRFELGFVRSGNKGCFDARTELTLADGTRKKIERITTEDVLWNPITRQPRKINKVIKGPERKPMVELLIGEKTLSVTEEHPFLTAFGYFPAAQLRAGDLIVTSGGTRMPLKSIRRIPAIPGPLNRKATAIPDSDLPVVWNVELENVSGNPDDYMVEANGIAAGDLWLQQKLKNPGHGNGT